MALKFSVVTPTLNNLDKLKRCVGSVRGQLNVDLEHIIHDACSTDGTVEWAKNQNKLSFTSQLDNGMYDAINNAWDESTGDILSWLNSDEQYLPGTLEIVQKVFKDNPEVDFIYGNAIIISNDGEPLAARREIRLSSFYIANSFLNSFSCTMFFRRELFDSGELRLNDEFKYASDMDMVLRLLKMKKKYIHIKQYLSLFTFDGENLSCSPKMLSETEKVQQKYGGFQFSLFRKLVTLGRYIERWRIKSYHVDDLTFHFAKDEVPTYKIIQKTDVPASYRTR